MGFSKKKSNNVMNLGKTLRLPAKQSSAKINQIIAAHDNKHPTTTSRLES